jgi:hypothetical protein
VTHVNATGSSLRRPFAQLHSPQLFPTSHDISVLINLLIMNENQQYGYVHFASGLLHGLD